MTEYAELSLTRGEAFKPAPLALLAKDNDGVTLEVPVAAYSDLECQVMKVMTKAGVTPPVGNVVGSVSLVPNAQGSITPVGDNLVQILIHDEIVATWTDQDEYFFVVQGHLLADGELHKPIKGRLQLGWT